MNDRITVRLTPTDHTNLMTVAFAMAGPYGRPASISDALRRAIEIAAATIAAQRSTTTTA